MSIMNGGVRGTTRALPHNHQKTAPTLLACSRCGGSSRGLPPQLRLEPLVYSVRLSRGHRGFQSAVQIKDVQRPFSVAAGAPNRSGARRKAAPCPPPPSLTYGIPRSKFSSIFTKGRLNDRTHNRLGSEIEDAQANQHRLADGCHESTSPADRLKRARASSSNANC